MKLAEALLRRKELQGKVDRIDQIRKADLFEIKIKRQMVTESIEDIQAQVPKLTLSEVTKEYDFYAKRLRLVDAAIQQANWTTEMDLMDPCVNEDFV